VRVGLLALHGVPAPAGQLGEVEGQRVLEDVGEPHAHEVLGQAAEQLGVGAVHAHVGAVQVGQRQPDAGADEELLEDVGAVGERLHRGPGRVGAGTAGAGLLRGQDWTSRSDERASGDGCTQIMPGATTSSRLPTG
jgi:hypothetical protein